MGGITIDRVYLYDTTLRDGTQRRDISLSLDDKVRIAELLDHYGIDFIEGGWPGSNPKDMAFFHMMKSRLKKSRLAAFGSTRRKDLPADQDPNLRAILETEVSTATLFGKSSPFQVQDILEISLDDNLRLVEESIRFLVDHGLTVLFDAEHFFDGMRTDPDYAVKVLKAAENGGAAWLVLCDTNGGTLPRQIHRIISEVKELVHLPLGIHAHDDSGLGVANSLEAVEAGSTMVQGTINGYGERCGNANLCTIWPNLVFKMDRKAGEPDMLKGLTHLSRTVAEIANLAPNDSDPYVGANAYAHKAGIHASAVRKHAEAYEHIPPDLVGQSRQVLVSELAGRANLLYHFEELSPNSPELAPLIDQIKQLEAQGYQFENAESSMRLVVHRVMGQVPTYFAVDRFHISVMHSHQTVSEATVRLMVGNRLISSVGDGVGPVHALDQALRKALTHLYPVLNELELTDYKVRVLNEASATASTVRVSIRSKFRDQIIQTVGASPNILEASWSALVDAIDYCLWTSDVKSLHDSPIVDVARPV